MHRSKLAITSALILPLGLALSACNEDEPAPDPETSQEPEETEESEEPEETEESEESEDDADAASGEYTEPGTELGLGEPASVHYEYTDESSADVTFSLDSIEEGSADDIADVENADGMVPFYLNFTVTGGAGAENLANTMISASDFDGLLEGDQSAGALVVMGSFEPCENDSLPEDFAEGDSHEFCVPALAPDGSEVVAGQFAASGGDYDKFDGDPIIWRQ